MGDRCGKKPSSITLVVYAEGYHAKRIMLKTEEGNAKDKKSIFKLPSIVLHQKPVQEGQQNIQK